MPPTDAVGQLINETGDVFRNSRTGYVEFKAMLEEISAKPSLTQESSEASIFQWMA